MDIRTLIKQIEHGEIEPVAGDADIGFYCQPDKINLAEPRHVSDYTDDSVMNVRLQKTLSTDTKTHHITPAVGTALETGWILPVPADILIYPNENGKATPICGGLFKPTGYIQNYVEKHKIATNDTVFVVNTQWWVDVPDGYSVLYTTPAIRQDTRFSVIPGVVDAGEFPLQIKVPVIAFESDFEMRTGLPLAHLYPFKHEDYTVTAETGILDETPDATE